MLSSFSNGTTAISTERYFIYNSIDESDFHWKLKFFWFSPNSSDFRFYIRMILLVQPAKRGIKNERLACNRCLCARNRCFRRHSLRARNRFLKTPIPLFPFPVEMEGWGGIADRKTVRSSACTPLLFIPDEHRHSACHRKDMPQSDWPLSS